MHRKEESSVEAIGAGAEAGKGHKEIGFPLH